MLTVSASYRSTEEKVSGAKKKKRAVPMQAETWRQSPCAGTSKVLVSGGKATPDTEVSIGSCSQ